MDADGAGGAVQHLVLRAARRRWPIVVVAVVITMGLGLGLSTQLPHKYTAVAQVLVNSVPSDASDPTKPKTIGLVQMSTEATVARSSIVRAAAVKRLPPGIRPGVINQGVITVVADTRVLRFAITARKKASATAAAAAYAQGYLDNRTTAATTYVAGQTKRLAGQIASLEKQITTVTAQRNAAAEGSSERQSLNIRLKALNTDLDAAQIALVTITNSPIQPGQIIQSPSDAQLTGPTAPSVLGIALLLGLIVGLALATLRERTDQRLLEPGDLQDDLGVPLLAELPPPTSDGGVLDPDGAAADAYRSLRNEIFLGPNPPEVLAVTRVDATTSTGDVTANLAVLLARSGRRVCVIDTDTGPGQRLETLLQGVDRVGLVHPGPDGRMVEPGIAVVTQREGIGQAKLGDMLASPLFKQLVDATREDAEVVLIDAPPALTSAGQAVLATADGVLLVVTKRRTRRRDVQNAKQRIRRAGSRLVGTALRDTETRQRGPVGRPGRRGPVPTPQPALSPPERPALPGGFTPTGAAATIDMGPISGTVTDAGVIGPDQESFRVSRPAAYQPSGEPIAPPPPRPTPVPPQPTPAPTPPAPTPGPAAAAGEADPVSVPLGWPSTPRPNGRSRRNDGEPAGLGWPEIPPMLTVAAPKRTPETDVPDPE
ncbi:MAG: tyrosine-protein kinase Etk/Wzc [Frankiales bacterium]|jgi:Mrp family chromosome partitioning ATPase/capsular polysaccharide biosynthesis protein|nr:tyrosine-protein kinase Etk/Wzc [Frankiales bacterium]